MFTKQSVYVKVIKVLIRASVLGTAWTILQKFNLLFTFMKVDYVFVINLFI